MKFKTTFLLLALVSCEEKESDRSESSQQSKLQNIESTESGNVTTNRRTASDRILVDPDRKKQIASATVVLTELVKATEAYFDEYSELPLGQTSSVDGELLSSQKLMATLLGLRSAAEQNYKELSFFAAKMAKDGKDGLRRSNTEAELFDPWGNHYHLVLNYDYDDELEEPSSIGTEVHYATKVLAWSDGPDKKSGSKETNKDNVYSWAKSD